MFYSNYLCQSCISVLYSYHYYFFLSLQSEGKLSNVLIERQLAAKLSKRESLKVGHTYLDDKKKSFVQLT